MHKGKTTENTKYIKEKEMCVTMESTVLRVVLVLLLIACIAGGLIWYVLQHTEKVPSGDTKFIQRADEWHET